MESETVFPFYIFLFNFQLNIHRFKVIARFGLMHVVATNICVWIRTLVIEYLKEINNYHMKMFNSTLPNDISPYYAGKVLFKYFRNVNTYIISIAFCKRFFLLAMFHEALFCKPFDSNF